MCTAISFTAKDHYFGRTLDYECSYGEQVVIMPSGYPLSFRFERAEEPRYAVIGMAHVAEGYPLYYDAVNEKGLGMAGLNFPQNARYFPKKEGKNVSPFEFIPYILSSCACLAEAREKLRGLNLVSEPFGPRYPLSPLHWIIADRSDAVVVEQTEAGLAVYDDPAGVLTNNPPFPMQEMWLANFMKLSPEPPENAFSARLPLSAYSRGMGAMGLPGDLSSASRFVRAAFVKENSLVEEGEESSVNQFFHILASVAQLRGCVHVEDGYERTIYTSCANATRGIYYYTTYENSRPTAVSLAGKERGKELIVYPLRTAADFYRES